MGRKIITYLSVLGIPVLFLCGCADFELHLREKPSAGKTPLVLLAPFGIRNMNYDPFVSDELRDAVKYEFFRRGFNVVLVPEKSSGTDSEWAAKTCSGLGGDILISGVISQRESGFLAERETETIVSFTVYSKNGSVIGEGYYHDDESAGSGSFRRDAAASFVSKLIKNTVRAE